MSTYSRKLVLSALLATFLMVALCHTAAASATGTDSQEDCEAYCTSGADPTDPSKVCTGGTLDSSGTSPVCTCSGCEVTTTTTTTTSTTKKPDGGDDSSAAVSSALLSSSAARLVGVVSLAVAVLATAV